MFKVYEDIDFGPILQVRFALTLPLSPFKLADMSSGVIPESCSENVSFKSIVLVANC